MLRVPAPDLRGPPCILCSEYTQPLKEGARFPMVYPGIRLSYRLTFLGWFLLRLCRKSQRDRERRNAENPPCARASQVVLAVKSLPANAGDLRDAGLIPGLGRSPGGGHGNPLQYSCLEDPMDRDWQAAVHRVTQSQTRLKRFSAHAHTIC